MGAAACRQAASARVAPGRGGVFSQIAGGEAGAVDRLIAGVSQCPEVGTGETAAFLHHAVGQTQTVRQQQSLAFRQREFAEDHLCSPR